MILNRSTIIKVFIIALCLTLLTNSSGLSSKILLPSHRPLSSSTNLSFSSLDEVTKQFSSLPHINEERAIYSQAKDMMSQAAESISENPNVVESALFGDLSHLALDFSIFMISPEQTALLRLLSLIGRLFSLLSDYIPDHSMRPDELAFQTVMLGISSVLFTRSVTPRLIAFIPKQSVGLPNRRDVLAFRTLFEPAGLTWMQQKTLFANGAFTWEEIESEDNLTTSQDVGKNNQTDLFWVYDEFSKTFETPDNVGELGCIQFLQQFEKRKNPKKDFSKSSIGQTSSTNDVNELLSSYKNDLQEGTVLLSINVEKVIRLIEDNEDLSVSMLLLVVNCLQQKVLDHVVSFPTNFSVPPMNDLRNTSHQTLTI